jgi:ribosomal protein S9
MEILKTPIHFTNKRKKAIASCRMTDKAQQSESLQITVNKKPFYEYFAGVRNKATKVSKLEEYSPHSRAFVIKTSGGGLSAQLEAVISSISKALVSLDPNLKKILKEKRFYKHDPRQHERNKPGLVKRRKDSPYRKR